LQKTSPELGHGKMGRELVVRPFWNRGRIRKKGKGGIGKGGKVSRPFPEGRRKTPQKQNASQL